jgi:ubiquinone/menaquinone biosynthesis C-methylase UbiE
MNDNNPYHRTARRYDAHLRLPIISLIRRDEERVVTDILSRYGDPSTTALEIGPGTGHYTLTLSRLFGEVVAVEDSVQMVHLLRTRLEVEGVTNVRIVPGDFRLLSPAARCDVAVAVGVLDYIADPAAFVARMCEVARRAVVVTVPRRGLLGAFFVAGGAMQRTRIYCCGRDELEAWAPGWSCSITEAGRLGPLGRGLTLIAAFER